MNLERVFLQLGCLVWLCIYSYNKSQGIDCKPPITSIYKGLIAKPPNTSALIIVAMPFRVAQYNFLKSGKFTIQICILDNYYLLKNTHLNPKFSSFRKTVLSHLNELYWHPAIFQTSSNSFATCNMIIFFLFELMN